MNGSGSGRPSPSTVTWRSSMASSSAAWVLGGVRLISSARSRLVNTGPSRKRKEPAPEARSCSKMVWPVMSEGIRSGVNCTRLNSRSRLAASALVSSVLAVPGTPSSSTCPRTSSAATSPDTAPSWPTTALAISSRTRSTASLAGTGDLPTDGINSLAERDQRGLVVRGCGCYHCEHSFGEHTGPGGDGGGELLGWRRGGHAEPFADGAAQVSGEQVGCLAPLAGPLQQVADGDDQLGAGQPHRLRLTDRLAEAPRPPQHQHGEGDHQLPQRQLDPRCDQVGEPPAPTTWQGRLQHRHAGPGAGGEQA